jgi:hypothetical protein
MCELFVITHFYKYFFDKTLKAGNFQAMELWSTKEILLWLRSHGYTPLDDRYYFNNSKTNESSANTTDKGQSKQRKYICSLSPCTDLLLNKTNQINININSEIEINNMNEYIDIVSSASNMSSFSSAQLPPGSIPTWNQPQITCQDGNVVNTSIDEQSETNKNFEFLISMSEGGKCMREQLDMV